MNKFKQNFHSLLRAVFARGGACAMAVVIFFESCTRYDITPREEAALAEAQRRAAREGRKPRGVYEPAIRLTAEDKAFRDRLAAMMQRAGESPAAARAILSEQAQLPEGDARRLDAFTLSLVRVMGDAELHAAIAAGDKEGIVGRLLALRGEVKLDAATREQLQRIAAEYGVEVGEGGMIVPEHELQSIFVPLVAIAAFWVAAAVVAELLVSAQVLLLCDVKALGCNDEKIGMYVPPDAYVALSQIDSEQLRYDVISELEARSTHALHDFLSELPEGVVTQEQEARIMDLVRAIMSQRVP